MRPARLAEAPCKKCPCCRARDDIQEYSAPQNCSKAFQFPGRKQRNIPSREIFFLFLQMFAELDDGFQQGASLRAATNQFARGQAPLVPLRFPRQGGVLRLLPRRAHEIRSALVRRLFSSPASELS